MPIFSSVLHVEDMTVLGRLRQISWGMVFLIVTLACIGFSCLYSAAGGNLDPWASRQILLFLFALAVMVAVAVTDVRWVFRLAYPFYAVTILLLIMVDAFGHIGMGAQRWLDLGVIKLQPSELAKISTIMALARYFHAQSLENTRKIKNLIVPVSIIGVPFLLVAAQPDLGTGMSIVFGGIAMLFAAGVSMWIFILGITLGLAALPLAWNFLLHDYQRNRVKIFLDPESDPLGAGFHITQSKIAIGSGGVFGKGFLEGTQSGLNFLPEKHTDFIFTLWAEEWGLAGGLTLIGILSMIILYGYWISFRCRNSFTRLLAFGLTVNFSIYVIINIGMVMGLLPVVGIPLPLMSYGGTAMLTVMVAFGMILGCNTYRDAKLPRGM
jgi:rod shape determining protein RodA